MAEVAWYALRTKPRQEDQVGALMEHRDVEFFLPVMRRTRPTRSGRRTTPLFSSYLFVRFAIPSDEYVRVRSAPGVIGVVCFDGAPAVVPDDVVESIKKRVESELRAKYPSTFSAGQHVKFTEGPFRDMEGIFNGRLTAAGRAEILIDMLHRQWRVQANLTELCKAS